MNKKYNVTVQNIYTDLACTFDIEASDARVAHKQALNAITLEEDIIEIKSVSGRVLFSVDGGFIEE